MKEVLVSRPGSSAGITVLKGRGRPLALCSGLQPGAATNLRNRTEGTRYEAMRSYLAAAFVTSKSSKGPCSLLSVCAVRRG